MDKPDYSTYTELQLEQVLTRIDKERFPERVEEIRERLATLQPREPRLKGKPPSHTFPRTISVPHEKVRLTRVVLPIIAFTVVGNISAGFPNTPMLLATAACLAFAIFLARFAATFADVVVDWGNALVITIGDINVRVMLNEIESIDYELDESSNYIQFHVGRETQLGKRFRFFPLQAPGPENSENAIYSELDARITAARMSTKF